ncbi:MAG: ribosome maturation factor RimP [Bacteroidota bacterium]
MRVDDILEQAVDRCVEDQAAHLIDLVIRGEKGNRIVQIFVDSETGVTVDQCTAISRTVSETISRTNLVPGSYRLEVSSPGADRPLKYSWQYGKHVGRPFRVKRQTTDATSSVEGTLSSADETEITLEQSGSGESVHIPYGEIVEAKVVTPW